MADVRGAYIYAEQCHQPVPANVSIHGMTRNIVVKHLHFMASCSLPNVMPLVTLDSLMHYMWWGALFPIDAHVCNVASMKDLLGHASAGPPSLSRLPSLCYGAVACHIKRDVAGDVHPYHLPMLQHCHYTRMCRKSCSPHHPPPQIPTNLNKPTVV